MTTRKEQKEQRREQILMAALELFVKKGFSATKISDIASAASMSTGLLFHYFESKDALLEELIKIGLGGTQMAMQSEAMTPLEFFRHAAKTILGFIKENKTMAYMFVLMERSQRDDSIPAHIRNIALKVDNIEKSVSLIEAGQRAGEIRGGDPLALSMAYWSSIQGIAVTLALCGEMPVPDPEWVVELIKKND